MQRINLFLRNEAATITVLLMALAAQMPHAASVFANIIGGEWITGWLFAIAMESAVLLFVIRGRIRVSYVFASISILMNLSYYAMHDIAIFQLVAFPAWLVSFVLPSAIALYSHDVAGHTDATETPTMPVRIDMDIDTPRLPAKPQRRTEVVSVANVPVHVPEHAADVRFVEDTPQVAQKETAIERNARLQAETVRKVEALHGLTADERRSKLLQMLRNGHANATQPELASIFDVSVSTISRDMSILQSQLKGDETK